VGEYIPTTSTINSAPRFDHDPTTGESLGLLVEESRQNLCLQSEDFSTTWVNVESSENVNAIIAPNGALTADALVENTASAAHALSQALAFVSGFSYTYSIYVKAGTRSEVRITLGQAAFGAGGSTLTVNLFDGSLIAQTSADNYDIISVGNGWYRISLTDTAASSASAAIVVFPTVGNVGAYSGVSGDEAIYLWGAQVEAGSFPTSYIPTTTAAATRAADVASISGSNFSSWYRQDEGTVFVRAATFSTGTTLTHAISDGTFNESIYANFSGGNAFRGANVLDAGVSQPNSISTFTGLVASDGVNDALAFQANNFGESLNGLATRTDNTGTIPTVDRLFIGSNWAGIGNFLNGHIRRLTYWPARLPDETLQTITQ
jgi:hypothetical protein